MTKQAALDLAWELNAIKPATEYDQSEIQDMWWDCCKAVSTVVHNKCGFDRNGNRVMNTTTFLDYCLDASSIDVSKL